MLTRDVCRIGCGKWTIYARSDGHQAAASALKVADDIWAMIAEQLDDEADIACLMGAW